VLICHFGTIRKVKNEETLTKNFAFTERYAPPEFINELLGSYLDVLSTGPALYYIYY